MSYRKHLMTSDEPPSELYKATDVGTNLAEVGTDCISRQAAIDAINRIECTKYTTWYEFYQKVITAVGKLPPAEPKRGKWIRDGHHIRCDQCGIYMCDTDREGDRIPTEFCPSFGAKMEGEQDG